MLPELYRHLAYKGADILFVPAAFTAYTGKTTGKCYPSQSSENTTSSPSPDRSALRLRQSHGHAMIIDLVGGADAGDQPGGDREN